MNDIIWFIFAFVGTFIIGVILGAIIMLLKCDKRFNNMVFGNLIKDDNSLYIQINDQQSYERLNVSKYAMFKIIVNKPQK